jgi:precorrin-6Y C5,15-methyltransferase (decarboxylating)
MSEPWLTIIGFGEGEMPTLPQSEVVLGPKRAIERLRAKAAPAARLIEWTSPRLDDMIAQVQALRGKRTVMLASGDPLWFGIGATLARHMPPEEFTVSPHASSFQLAAARMRWPMQQVETVSLHARPVALLHPLLAPGMRILALTTDAGTANKAAQLLTERGYGSSRLTVLENLGGADERISSAEALQFSLFVGDFYVLAIECVADADAALLPPVPGLPDPAFAHDGQLTKREVRAATLARLAPFAGALLWDIGAGSGSVGIEWMRAARGARAIAFERDPARREFIERNRMALGTPDLVIERQAAPDGFADKQAPDAIFLGGSVADESIFAPAWSALKPGGRFVANAVTLDGEAALIARQAEHGGELVRISIERLEKIGGQAAFRPLMPVLQWAASKPVA